MGKLIEALEMERAKCKQFRSKFNSVQQELQSKLNSAQQELQTAEITVKELAAIEGQLREENANLRETIGGFGKIRWKEEKIKSQEEINSEKEMVDQKYIRLKKELEDQKLKYRKREEELENSLETTKQQIEKWEESKANDMVNMAFNLSGITIKGLEQVMNCLVDKVNQKQIIINNQTQEIENLKRDTSEKLGKTQRYIDHMKRERLGGTEILRTKLTNWRNYFLDLENDHYEGLKRYNIKIEELQRKLEWANRNGRKFETSKSKMSEQNGRQNLELTNKFRKAEEMIDTTSEQLKSAKEETGELEKVYQEERRN